jgi:hypothetical protein
MVIPEDKLAGRLLAVEAAALVVHEDDTQERLQPLVDRLVASLGNHRVSLAVVCQKPDSRWLKDDVLASQRVTVTVLRRQGDTLTMLRRVRRAPERRAQRAPAPEVAIALEPGDEPVR